MNTVTAQLLIFDKARSVDPTGTHKLRVQWREMCALRLRQFRAALRLLVVDRDALGLGLGQPQLASRAQLLMTFGGVVRELATNILLSEWVGNYIGLAWQQGYSRAVMELGAEHVAVVRMGDMDMQIHAANNEFAGIVSAALQAALRAANNVQGHGKSVAFTQIAEAFDKIAAKRMWAAVDFCTVQTYNRAKIAAYRFAGVPGVGVIPEQRQRARDSINDAAFDPAKHPHGYHGQWATIGKIVDAPVGKIRYGQTAGDTNKDRVKFYREQIRDGKKLAPLSAVLNSQTGLLHLTDGHHRWLAAKAEGLKTVKVKIESIAANAREVNEYIREVRFGGAYDSIVIADADLVGIRTAGDDRVCQECEDFADGAPYDLDEVDRRMPLHAHCRCSVYPWLDRRFRHDAATTIKTLYVRRNVLNADAIIAWAKAAGFATTLQADDMHVTVCYSKSPLDWSSLSPLQNTLTLYLKCRLDWFGDDNEVAVLTFDSPELALRHSEFTKAGAVWSWPIFEPHVTISWKQTDKIAPAPYNGPIVLGPEVFEQVKAGWAKTVSEDALPAFDPAKHPHAPGGSRTGGQFTTTSAAHLMDKYRDNSITAENIIASVPGAAAKVAEAERKLALGIETNKAVEEGGYMRPDGTYTEARQAAHMRIIEAVLTEQAVKAATPAPGHQPICTVLGGRGGSGKTWLTNPGGPVDKAHAIYLNSDDIKEMLPGYEGWNAGLLHEEAKDVMTHIDTMCRELGVNVIHDATMRSAATTARTVQEYKNAGYRIEGYYMFVPPHISTQRALSRFMHRGRYVPPSYTMSSLANEQTFDAMKPQFDKWAIYQNMGKQPALVAHG